MAYLNGKQIRLDEAVAAYAFKRCIVCGGDDMHNCGLSTEVFRHGDFAHRIPHAPWNGRHAVS